MSQPLLEVSNLTVSYGRVAALRDVTLRVGDGQIVAVLGANGAGKSTLLLSILGALKPSGGDIYFAGARMTAQPMHRRVGAGIVLVPEGRQILISLTIEENLLLGAHLRKDTQAVRREIEAIYDRFPNLASRKDMLASSLSGGEQQMLAVGRAMLARPKLMMMDEPSLGLSPLFISRLFDLIREFNRDGLSILLIEQNTGKALSVAHHAVVLELGRVVLEGDPSELARDPRLQEAYLGGATTDHQSA
ncbi:ABC transporter ATP-binding protein [Rhodopseudomonas sp. P2A-2r]|uniref:ABC transporter ATP-binding protein n=1 Tax=unclassified Rhodopseudomonas TaxID=2638247 RepID=UPI002234DBAB|nr:ABC transporter ATP-binding protein [Rhodopseudomonas sp. P2A-2r]UZE51285.1 ABC transporter ATP-binding protein [Rhodopseudomonas sp. P2A-2r]